MEPIPTNTNIVEQVAPQIIPQKEEHVKIWTVIVTALFFTIALFLLPVVLETSRAGGEEVLLTGEHKAPFLNVIPGSTIFTHGAFGIIFGSISWYWFIGLIALLVILYKKIYSIKKGIALTVFFILCLLGLYILRIGGSLPYIAASHPIIKHLSGYYVYITLIVYLIAITLYSSFIVQTEKINRFFMFASIIAILCGTMFGMYFTKLTFEQDLNKEAMAYETKSSQERANLETYRKIIEEEFGTYSSRTGSEGFYRDGRITFNGCESTMGEPSPTNRTCLKSKIRLKTYAESWDQAMPPTYIQEALIVIGRTLQNKQQEYFSKTFPVQYSISNRSGINSDIQKSSQCLYNQEVLVCK